MELLIGVIWGAAGGALVGESVHLTGGPNWAAVGFGFLAYLASRIRSGRVLLDGRGEVEVLRSTVNQAGEPLTGDRDHPCRDGQPEFEFRWTATGGGELPATLSRDLHEWHPPHWGSDGIARFTGGERLTLEVRAVHP